MYALRLEQPFSTSDNVSGILRRIPKIVGTANDASPDYYSGSVFSSNFETYSFGGLLRDTDRSSLPSADATLGYQVYPSSGSAGFVEGKLTAGVTRFVTGGAGVSVQSEALGFYFSGVQRHDGGDIRRSGRAEYNATAPAAYMIKANLGTVGQATWTNETLPDYIAPRADAELAWIPVAQQGLLLAFGGAASPEWVFKSMTEAQKKVGEESGRAFMTNIAVYDVATNQW